MLMPKINIYFIFLSLILVFTFQRTEAAGTSLILSPASESFIVGDTFSVEIKVDTAGIPINAAQATIYFPVDKLEVLNISKDDSVFSLWPKEPTFSNLTGEVSFTGGLPHPGFQEIENLITVEFKAKEEGRANFTFDKAQVLADDGKGTNVLVYLKAAKYSIFKEIIFLGEEPDGHLPQILSSTHPQENEWYNNNHPHFQWNLTPEITSVSFVLNQNPETIPDTISEGKTQFKNYEKIPDGMWYFHLRFENKNGWIETAHYKIQIDNLPPHPFEVVIDNTGDPTNPKPNLYFETSDDTSGISYYKFKIDKEKFLNLMLAQVNPFSLSSQSPGQHQIIVRAVDQAGNNVETKTVLDVEPIESPKITLWPQIHISGEEILYIEGQASADAEITIFLKKDGKDIKKWQALSNNQGEWSFSSKELIESGTYYLLAQAQDKRGAVSYLSDSYKMAVSLSGLSLGPLMVSFKTLVFSLLSVLLLGLIMVGFFIYRIRLTKKTLQKETTEAEKSLHQVFSALREEVEEQIKMFDSQPGFSEKEKKIYDDLKIALDISEELIGKEIKDIEKELT